jgi:hypothetical protein
MNEPKRRGRPPKRVEQDIKATASPAETLARIAEQFRAEHPDEWEKLRLCPLQHGLQDMERLLK